MSVAATSSASTIFEQSQHTFQQQASSFLPDTISEFGSSSTTINDRNSALTLFMAAGQGGQAGFPVSCSGILSMGTPSSANYIFSSNNSGGGESADHSSNSSSRTRLVGLGGGNNTSSSINDSGLSTLSSTTGCGNNSTLLIPINLLSSTPVQQHLLLQQPQPCHYSPDSSKGPAGLPAEPHELDDFEAVPRDRCNTWPLRRPTLDINAQTSPLIHDKIPEEDNAYDEGSDTIDDNCDVGMLGGDVSDEMGMIGSPSGFSNEMSPMRSDSAIGESRPDSPPSSKKSTTRRNAWGNMSYADLITQAIFNSPDKRLTLSQVYEWMVQNVPYFRDKGDSNSSAGWKNSIRHNLSLHSRFMRIQNEGAGKSSWWVINPDAKPGRNPRRRAATMETATKGIIDKKRRGARKRVEMGISRGIPSAGTSVMSSQASILSQDYECEDVLGNDNFDTFRPRTQSTLSIPGTFEGNSSHVSPTLEPPGFENFDFPPWMDAVTGVGGNPEHVTELLHRTDSMRLDNCGGGEAVPFAAPSLTSRPLLNGVKLESGQQAATHQQTPMDTNKKQEPMGVAPPPSYQELNSVRGTPSQIQNTLLRGQVNLNQQPKLPSGILPYFNRNGNAFNQSTSMSQQSTSSPPQSYVNMVPTMQPPQWAATSSSLGPQGFQLHSNGTNSGGVPSGNVGLPLDLESLAMPTDGQSTMLDLDMVDMDAVLRHELSQSNNLGFD